MLIVLLPVTRDDLIFIGVIALMAGYSLTRHIITQSRADRKLARELEAQAQRHKAELRRIILLLGTLMAEYKRTNPPHVPLLC
jgi:hypothetical protein